MPVAPAPPSTVLDQFFEALEPRVEGELRRDSMSRALYATDASMYQITPFGVLLPRHEADVQAALEEASRFQVPILPRGGGSSLAGQTVGEALIIDFSRYMDGILSIDAEAQTATVQPGLVLDRLNAACAEHGLMVGPDPASSSRATLGGMVANNATGTHSIQYGNMIHHVRRLKGFLADGTPVEFNPLPPAAWDAKRKAEGREGELYRSLGNLLDDEDEVIRRDTPKHWRRNSGYRVEHLLVERPEKQVSHSPYVTRLADAPAEDERSIAQLICGSEGTLAVITEIEIGLVEKPAETVLGIVHFETRNAALRAVTRILETEPSAVELFDGVAIERCSKAPGFADRMTFIEGNPGGALITEYSGDSKTALERKLDELEEAMESSKRGGEIKRVVDDAGQKNVWSVRKEGLGLIMGVKSEFKPVAFIEDASVPVENLADYVEALDSALQETGTRAAFYAHASAGCLHIRPFINTKDAAEVEKMKRIAQDSMELVSQFGGSVSSEHGDGIARSWLNEAFLGPELCSVYRRVKDIFDPGGILNPGKIVDAPPMDKHLRMGPDYETKPMLTEMDFSEDGSFAAAVELCNGNGACRKLDNGTMCPSFMATREEADSTRGRANALRNALSGNLPEEALTSEDMFEVMDLCIQCKACKTECPSNVDMAKIKTEWLSKYWQKNRTPLRTRVFAHLPRISKRIAGTSLAKMFNSGGGFGPVQSLMNRTLGISKERKLPPFASETFAQWYRKQSWEADGPTVVLFVDTFSNYHTPEIAKAAAQVLRKIGVEVVMPEDKVCCGRTYLSKGLVSEAQVKALETVAALYPYAAQGLPIVGLEPSCTSALADDFRDLIPGDPRTEQVADCALSFDRFLARLAKSDLLDEVDWTDDQREVIFHGHCHQKALEGAEATAQILSLPPEYTVHSLDAGCCGMAGAFGYEKEHVEISKKMAERKLAPAIREAEEDAIIAATGFSCRSQIKDTTGRAARHPAEILLEAMS